MKQQMQTTTMLFLLVILFESCCCSRILVASTSTNDAGTSNTSQKYYTIHFNDDDNETATLKGVTLKKFIVNTFTTPKETTSVQDHHSHGLRRTQQQKKKDKETIESSSFTFDQDDQRSLLSRHLCDNYLDYDASSSSLRNSVDCYKALRGDVLHFISNPYDSPEVFEHEKHPTEAYEDNVEYYADGLLILKRVVVQSSEEETPLRYKALRYSYVVDRIVKYDDFANSISPARIEDIVNFQLDDHRPGIIMPGFVDLHVHATQENVVASYGASLLPWLSEYVLPEEDMMASNNEYAQLTMRLFIRDCLRAGTTTPVAYTTYNDTVPNALFEEAEKINMLLLTGAQGQDWYNPNDNFINSTRYLYNKWHNRGRAKYAMTIRFAPGSSYTQLKEASTLLNEELSDSYFMTHLGETYDEVHMASLLYQHDGIPQGLPTNEIGLPPDATYTQLYDYFGLLKPNRTIMGHSIHLSIDDWQLLASKGVSVAHCPTSNNFLGSGLFNVGAAVRANVDMGVGSDVGAGTHLCTLNTLGAMYQVAQQGNAYLSSMTWLGIDPPDVCVSTFCPHYDAPNIPNCDIENNKNVTVKGLKLIENNSSQICHPLPRRGNYPHQTIPRPDAGVPPNNLHIHPALAYYTATLGGARALHLEQRIGNFARGSDADIVVLNPFGSYDAARRTRFIYSSSKKSLDYLWKRLFILMTVGHGGGGSSVGGEDDDDSSTSSSNGGGNIAATYVAGHMLYENTNVPTFLKNSEAAKSILDCVLPDDPKYPEDNIQVAQCAAELSLSGQNSLLDDMERQQQQQKKKKTPSSSTTASAINAYYKDYVPSNIQPEHPFFESSNNGGTAVNSYVEQYIP